MERRTLLKTVGATVIGTGAISGCLGGGFGDNNDDTTQSSTQKSTQGTESDGDTTNTKESDTDSTQTSGNASGKIVTTELQTEEGAYTTQHIGFVEVKNTGDAKLFGPSLNVKFLDENDSVLETSQDAVYVIKPGQKWESRSLFTGDKSPARIEANLEEDNVDPNISTDPKELKLSNIQLETGQEPVITGKVKNTSKTTIDVTAYSQFLKEDETIVGVGVDTVTGLSAGQSWTINANPLIIDEQLAQKMKKYDLYFQII